MGLKHFYMGVLGIICCFSHLFSQGTQYFNLAEKPEKERFQLKEKQWPIELGGAEVCLYEDDKTAAVSIAIDDNHVRDHFWWTEQALRFKWKFTWFLIVDYIRQNPTDCGTWEDFRKLAKAGHSVQSHTFSHHSNGDTLSDDVMHFEYGHSRAMIRDSIPGDTCNTLAYPWGVGKPELAKNYYIASRGTYGKPNCANQTWYLNTNAGYIDSVTLATVLVKDSAQPFYYRGWISPILHGLDVSQDQNRSSLDTIVRHLEYLKSKENEVWVGLFEDIARYCQERDTHILTVIKKARDSISFNLTDSMQDVIYGYPLTVKVCLGALWSDSVRAYQNNKPIPVTKVFTKGLFYALVKAVPDRGTVFLVNASQQTGINLSSFTIKTSILPSGQIFDLKGRLIRRLAVLDQGPVFLKDGAYGKALLLFHTEQKTVKVRTF
ncbi:MAG: polysaccharide deacetylase family protein [Chitinivibrionales bacterium]|nr:polysaccharide deacetylase family protein [Chitinivibrionales bacterium]